MATQDLVFAKLGLPPVPRPLGFGLPSHAADGEMRDNGDGDPEVVHSDPLKEERTIPTFEVELRPPTAAEIRKEKEQEDQLARELLAEAAAKHGNVVTSEAKS